jgi:hypothetical protein
MEEVVDPVIAVIGMPDPVVMTAGNGNLFTG